MSEIIIPVQDILVGHPVSSTVIKFVNDCGFYCGVDFEKPARIEIDSMRYEFFELQRMLAKEDMEIKIIQ